MSIPYAKEAGAALILVALAFSHGCVYRMAGSKARADKAEQAAAYERQLAHAIQAARVTERRKALDIAEITEQNERDKRNAQDRADALVTGLANGNDRLRAHWQGCEATGRVSGAAASASLADAARKLREADTGHIVGIAAEADAKERALQAVIVADRK